MTNHKAIEENLKWTSDGSIFFTGIHSGTVEGAYEDSQGRLYNLNLMNNRIQRCATQFRGQVTEHDLLQGGKGGVVILGHNDPQIQI